MAKPKIVKAEDFHVPVADVLEAALKDARQDNFAVVAVVGMDLAGDVVLAASVAAPQTVNLLRQGIEVATGDREPADPEE
jgi:hypothetical protein